ncbi:MAG TPA: L-threonylcarbamoyladenylate synthase [Gemmatimonadaceae bacterium]|nr:L-threonylcarbamoyladenylate synthase [Gemmatimonadaceae bacterium]
MTPSARAIPFWSPAEIEAAIPGTIAHLQAHRVLAYPTETVYGLGGAIDRASVDALLEIKRRPRGKPFLVLIAASGMIDRLGLTLTKSAGMLAARFWPGPLTLVLPGGERRVPEALRGPEGGIAVRWTPHAGMQKLIAAYGDAITSTSANQPGSPPAANAADIVSHWSALVAAGKLRVLDAGTLAPSEPSTVVDCTGRVPRVIRPGAVSAARLREAVPGLVGDR